MLTMLAQAILNNMLRHGGLTRLPRQVAASMSPVATVSQGHLGSSEESPALQHRASTEAAQQASEVVEELSRTYLAENGNVTVGLLPLSSFGNGHSFFVQHPCAFTFRIPGEKPASLPAVLATPSQLLAAALASPGQLLPAVLAISSQLLPAACPAPASSPSLQPVPASSPRQALTAIVESFNWHA